MAARFRVSVRFVNDMLLLEDATGAIAAKHQDNGGGTGKFSRVAGCINSRIKEKRDLTLDELVAELRDGHGGEVHRVARWRFLRSFCLTHNKDLLAVKQKRPDVGSARPVWIGRRQSFIRNMLTRLAYIDIEAGKGIDPGD